MDIAVPFHVHRININIHININIDAIGRRRNRRSAVSVEAGIDLAHGGLDHFGEHVVRTRRY